MPTVAVSRRELFLRLGKTYSDEEFENLCFKFGIELDEVGPSDDFDGEIAYKIEVAANRYDLLCVGGIARALKCFLGLGEIPAYTVTPGKQTLTVKKEVSSVRPYVFAAVLRNITFTQETYKSFIDLQDKFHRNIGRKRTLVSIGTHDLDTIQGPFVYNAKKPEEICFLPLVGDKKMNANEIMALYESHAQLKHFLHIIKDEELYPVIYDSAGDVLSLPPIINGEKSKITLNTKNVFIEITCMNPTKGEIVLNNLVAVFSAECSPQFQIETVEVVYEKGHTECSERKFINPNLAMREMTLNVEKAQQLSGIPNLSNQMCIDLLKKMMVEPIEDKDSLSVKIPVTRADVIHECDLHEDCAIAYGFHEISSRHFDIGRSLDMSGLTNQLGVLLSTCCFTEALNWGLCSRDDAYAFLHRSIIEPVEDIPLNQYSCRGSPVVLSDPKTREFEIVRPTLIPGILKTLANNKGRELPIKLFELGDVVTLDSKAETGALNRKHCAILYANSQNSGLEDIHGVVEVLLGHMGFKSDYKLYEESDFTEKNVAPGIPYFVLKSSSEKMFLAGRQVEIVIMPLDITIGIMGTIHPAVLKNFNITLPASLVEINLQGMLEWLERDNLFEE